MKLVEREESAAPKQEENMHELNIYGVSDDLVEIEGDFREELNYPYISKADDPQYLAISDGTLLKIVYDGFWRLTVHHKGTSAFSKHEATNEETDYSDVVTLTNVLPFKFVMLGDKIAKP